MSRLCWATVSTRWTRISDDQAQDYCALRDFELVRCEKALTLLRSTCDG